MKHILTAGLVALLLVNNVSMVLGQEIRWLGADDDPVKPLACDSAPAEPMSAGIYDGATQGVSAERIGQTITVVNVAGIQDDLYDAGIMRGMQAAAQELGTINLLQGADGSDQALLLERYAQQAVDVALVDVQSAVDAGSGLATLLSNGVHVISYGGDSEQHVREWFVQPLDSRLLAKQMIDQLVTQAGPDAGFAIITDSLDSPNEARWIAELWAYASACYPDLEWLETAETQGDNDLANNLTIRLSNNYREDLQAIISLIPLGTANVANAVMGMNQCATVAVVGLATPSSIRPFIESGCVQSAWLWSASDLGYASVYAARAVADGQLVPGSVSVVAGRLGELAIVNGSEILLGEPLMLNQRNINQFDF